MREKQVPMVDVGKDGRQSRGSRESPTSGMAGGGRWRPRGAHVTP